jgi:hypothetical protein
LCAFRRFSLAVITVALGFLAPIVAGEVAFRVAGWPRPVVIGWTFDGKLSERNELGFRGRPGVEGDATVVLLGDSQVEALASRIDAMPEAHLERALERHTARHIRVVSIGASGWGQDQQLLALKAHISAVRPWAVVLWFSRDNDVWNNTFPTHWPANGWPKPTYWLIDEELRGPNAPWLGSYRRREPYLVQLVRRAAHRPLYLTDEEWEARLPQAYRPVALEGTAPSLAATVALRRGIPIERLDFSGENFDTEKTHYHLHLEPESERLAYSLKLTRRLLQEIRQLCDANSARFYVFMLEDTGTMVPPGAIPEAPTLFEINGKGYVLSATSARRRLDDLLRDTPTILAPAPANAFVSATDLHLNDQGNRYAMDAIARRLHADLSRPVAR